MVDLCGRGTVFQPANSDPTDDDAIISNENRSVESENRKQHRMLTVGVIALNVRGEVSTMQCGALGHVCTIFRGLTKYHRLVFTIAVWSGIYYSRGKHAPRKGGVPCSLLETNDRL